MHLNPLQVDGRSTDGLAHLDGITGAVLAVGGGKMQEVRSVGGQQRIRPKVRTEAAGGEDHGPKLFHDLAGLLVLTTYDGGAILEQLGDLGLGDDPGAVSLLCHLLQHLDQCIGDGHAGEPLLPTVRPGLRVAAESGNQGKIQVKLVHEPIHVRGAVGTQNLGELRLLGATLQSVRDEDLLSSST